MDAKVSDTILRRSGYVLSGVALVGALVFPGLQLALLAALLLLASSQIGQ